MVATTRPERIDLAPWSAPRATAIGLALSVLVTVMVAAFCWPAVSAEPRDLPLAVVGPGPVVQQITSAVGQSAPGAFEIVPLADQASARAAIVSRDVVGALVVGQQGVTVLTAPGASQSVATLVETLGRTIGAHLLEAQGVTVPTAAATQVVVPAGPGDTFGAGFTTLVLPLVIGSLLTGLATAFVVAGAVARLVTLLVAAVLAGGGVALVAGPWLGVVPGSWAVAGVAALGVLAVASAVVGAHTVLGRVGVAAVAPVVLLLGNPLSAAAIVPGMLPAGWASLGQALPPGAIVQAVRSVAFFHGAQLGYPVTVLAVWAAAGVLLVATGLLRAARWPVGSDDLEAAPNPAHASA